jgi:SAM-dependent MidA family methyltransferase
VQPWRQAWERALYGPDGFYRRPEGPAGHFRTASHAAPAQLAAAVRRLAVELDCTTIIDVGAGRGELLSAVAALGVDDGPRLWGLDVVTRPPALPASVSWSQGLGPDAGMPDSAFAGALVIGWELLDVVPCTVLELDEDGVPREVLVDPRTGREALGGPASDADLAWCRRWWPLASLEEGDRAEVGITRDSLWAALTRRTAAHGGRALLAVDYAHHQPGRPNLGSLSGFRTGRKVPPRPDGTMDLTAHVAMDAVAEAGLAAGARGYDLTTQDKALSGLGVTAAELLDPGGLGAFDWLLSRV